MENLNNVFLNLESLPEPFMRIQTLLFFLSSIYIFRNKNTLKFNIHIKLWVKIYKRSIFLGFCKYDAKINSNVCDHAACFHVLLFHVIVTLMIFFYVGCQLVLNYY